MSALFDLLYLIALFGTPWLLLAVLVAVVLGRGIRMADAAEARTEELDLSRLYGRRTDTVLMERIP